MVVAAPRKHVCNRRLLFILLLLLLLEGVHAIRYSGIEGATTTTTQTQATRTALLQNFMVYTVNEEKNAMHAGAVRLGERPSKGDVAHHHAFP